MRHTLPIAPQFYVTAPQPCPYLEGRQERKLFTALHGDRAQDLNDSLSKQGFRRSQNVLYRPSCVECAACMSARIDVSKFDISKSQKRVAKKNMDVFEFAAMIEETPIRTRVIEYEQDDDLKAVCLTDVLNDGLSMVYSFFDPDLSDRSIGTYLILDHIKMAQELDLPYVYLGYWVPDSPKMGYKARFSGLEIYRDRAWTPLANCDNISSSLHPLNTAPIAEQVANLSLPGSNPLSE
jgi:arginyl-tRNA--protein-N-Asp/Glu arginylyltransferase